MGVLLVVLVLVVVLVVTGVKQSQLLVPRLKSGLLPIQKIAKSNLQSANCNLQTANYYMGDFT